MATFLRSLKFVRRLSQGRRLGSSSAHSSSVTPRLTKTQLLHLSRAQCALVHEDRTYVTKPAYNDTFYTHNDIDSLLNDLDQRVRTYQNIYKDHIDKILDVVTEKNSLTSIQALLLIRCCGEFLCLEKSQTRNALSNQIWEIIKELKVPIDVSHYNALLLIYLENGKDFSPVDVLLEMKTNNIEPNRVTFQRLIRQYCNKGDISGATKILEHMTAKEIPINENIFNSLIKGHSEAGDIPNATKILEIMKNAGIEPSSRTYAELLCAHAKRGDVESIRSIFNECRQKNIQIADKEILDIIYVLAVNQHLDIIDEMITYLNKGGLYNKDGATCILKLVEKDCLDVAYKLLKTLVKPENRENFESGGFFLRKLVTSGASPETIIKYCNKLKEEKLHNNPFELTIIHMFAHGRQNMALPIMKCWAETGAEIREHYFFPILVAHSKDNNLQGLLNTARTMVFDFKITPSILTIKEYLVPFLIEDPYTNARTLTNNHLPFSNVANATVLHLLSQSKPQQAYEFMSSTNLTYRLSMLTRTLARALGDTKDAASVAAIIHHQYVMAQKNLNQLSEDKLGPKEFSSLVVSKAAIELPSYDTQLMTKFLTILHEKGVGIDENAAEQVKLRLDKNITDEIKDLLNALVSDGLELKNIERYVDQQRYNRQSIEGGQDSGESKMLFIQQHIRIGDKETVEKLLSELEQENANYTPGFCAIMVDYFSNAENVEEATKWFNKFKEISSNAKINKAKVLRYATVLVANNQIEEALQALRYPINDVDANRSSLCEKLLDRVSTVCPDRAEEFLNLLHAQKFATYFTTAMFNPIVKVPLKAGNLDKAIENYKWACENYKLTPCKVLLMSHLINNEDAKTLKHVTDLSTKVHGEVNSLIDLAVAFFECNRPHQARKILETPGLRLNKERMRTIVDRYYEYDHERLEDFINLLNGLFLDMDEFYVKLLKSFGKRDEWEKSLALWTQLQEDNVQPSMTFMEELERILRRCNQEVPFASSFQEPLIKKDFDSALDAQNFELAEKILNEIPSSDDRRKLCMRLAESYLASNNLDKAVSYLLVALDENIQIVETYSVFIQSVIEKLVESDQFQLIKKLFTKFHNSVQKVVRKNLPYNKILNEYYLKQGKYNEFLSHLENLLDDSSSSHNLNFLFHITFNASLLMKQPEYLERMNSLAFKAVKHRNHFPMNSLWTYYFIRDDPTAEVIYNDYFRDTEHLHGLSAFFVCQDFGAWNRVPKLVEKITTSGQEFTKKRSTLIQIFRMIMASSEPKKHEIAYHCLRTMNKIVPLEKIQEKYITEIKENLPDNLSFESIKSDNDRVKTEATG